MQHLCTSRNNIEVIFDPVNSHIATHFADTPLLKAAVIEALKNTDVDGDDMFFEYNFGRVIGTTDLVETTDTDEVVFAIRTNRDVYTRFTTSQQPQDCPTVTIALKKHDDDGCYVLWSAWIGYIGPAFPGDANETPDSKLYWSCHALVWGRQDVQPGTETTVCPW
jgi:hypothetical protein